MYRHWDICAVLHAVFFLLIFSSAKGQFEGDSCRLQRDGSQGTCTSIRSCPEALTDPNSTPQLCMFIRSDPIVCCPSQANIFTQNQPISTNFGNSPGQPANTDQQPGFVSIRDGEGTSTISLRKCEEYSKLTTNKFAFVPLVIDPPVYEVEVPQCDYSVPLIVGGEEAKPGEFPHMAVLGWDSERVNDRVDWNCGGALISDDFVLTAAHCAELRGTPPKHVRLGDHNLARSDDASDPQEFPIKDIIKHPEYRPPSTYNDIALIRIDGRPRLGKFVRPACLWQTPTINYTQTVATGWGQIEFSGPKSDTLLKVTLDIISNDRCAPLFDISHRKLRLGIVETQMCAGYLDGGKDTCQGDSGGPIQVVTPGNICIFHIVGITSFGKSCGGADAPGVYTRVSAYLDWIESVVWPGQ